MRINLYNATFKVSAWERTNFYATIWASGENPSDVFDEQTGKIETFRLSSLSENERANYPSSKQIRDGKDVDNNELNKYGKASLLTDRKG